MRLRLEIIENADTPAFAPQKVGDVRTDQTGAASNESALSVRFHNVGSLGQIRSRPSRVEAAPREICGSRGLGSRNSDCCLSQKIPGRDAPGSSRSSTSYQLGNRCDWKIDLARRARWSVRERAPCSSQFPQTLSRAFFSGRSNNSRHHPTDRARCDLPARARSSHRLRKGSRRQQLDCRNRSGRAESKPSLRRSSVAASEAFAERIACVADTSMKACR